MISRRSFATLLCGAGLVAMAGCSAFEPSETLRFRITVEIDTPLGVRSGSSVWELTITDIAIGFTQSEDQFRGEAVAVKLPNEQTVFALLISEYGQQDYPKYLIREWLKTYPDYSDIDNKNFLSAFPNWTAVEASWEVPRKFDFDCETGPNCKDGGYPMFVTFKDINDPATVTKVDPDDFEASFGERYRLKSVTVTATNKPITTGFHIRYKSIAYHRKTFKPNPSDFLSESSENDLRTLDVGSFSTEIWTWL